MYNLIIVPFLALIVSQLIKVIIDATRGKFSWSNLNSYGGMPSSHSALVTALATEIGLTVGFASPEFAIASSIGFLFLRDAVGFRARLGDHGKILNQIIVDLPDYKESKYPHLDERLGHTYFQALIGALIGIIIAIII